jgi:hypothetical protein
MSFRVEAAQGEDKACPFMLSGQAPVTLAEIKLSYSEVFNHEDAKQPATLERARHELGDILPGRCASTVAQFPETQRAAG